MEVCSLPRIAVICLLISSAALAGSMETARDLIEKREYDRARSLLEKTVADKALEGESRVLLTRICNEQRTWEEGVEQGERAVAILPRSSGAHLQYAIALRLKMTHGSRLKAIFIVGTYKKTLQKALDLDPKNLDAREEEIGFLYQAPGVAGGDKTKARERIEDLKALSRPRAMYFEATLLRNENKNQESIAVLEALLKEDPGHAHARTTLAFWLQADRKFREANEHFAVLKASDDRQRSLAAQYQMARSHILGTYDQAKAVDLLLDYLRQSPENVPGIPSPSNAHWRLGNSYEQLGQIDKARQAYTTAVSLDGDNQEAREALKNLPGN